MRRKSQTIWKEASSESFIGFRLAKRYITTPLVLYFAGPMLELVRRRQIGFEEWL